MLREGEALKGREVWRKEVSNRDKVRYLEVKLSIGLYIYLSWGR